MTKEITKANILQEIEDKLGLRELVPERFAFSEVVLPIYNIEQHLEKEYTQLHDVSVTTTGALFFFTVPGSERWVISRYDIIFMAAGAYTVAGAFISRKNKSASGATIYLDLSAAQTISYHTELNQPLIMEPDDGFYINIDGYTSVADLRLIIDIRKSVIR